MRITFYGGAGQVTGANYLLDFGHKKVLVDCGLNQGTKFAEDLNYADFQYNPKEIDAVCITHSHMDHVGRLPKLYKDGFRGKIIATKPTAGLIMTALPNSLGLIKSEAERDGHAPLYGQEDIDGLTRLTVGLDYHQDVKIGGDITITLHDAGHILGSSIVEINWVDGNDKKRIYFSGDLGNPPTPFLRPTEYARNADYVVIESAYGDRIHEDRELRKEKLENAVENTAKSGGVLMIPSFAMERTQELLFELNELIENRRIPRIPVFVDSPLAIEITKVYKQYKDYFSKEATHLITSGDDIFKFPGLKLTQTTEESKSINDVPPPKIIIAGSGMSVGGRILHHEKRYLPDPNSAILFIGYQVEGSLGRKIFDIKEQRKQNPKRQHEVSIFGQKVPVNCRIEAIGGYSAHADQTGLIKWVRAAKSYLEGDKSCSHLRNAGQDKHNGRIAAKKDGTQKHRLKHVFVVQGEEKASNVLARIIRDALVVDATVPQKEEGFEL